MKQKVWFMVSSLRAGGAERVFWILSQHFDSTRYDVSLVLLNSQNPFFSTELKGVNVIHLNTLKASRSFFKLCKLIRTEKPDAIYSNGSHLNVLMAFVSLFVPIPMLIGREMNMPKVAAHLKGFKDMFWDKFVSLAYKRIQIGICQSEEIRDTLSSAYRIPKAKLRVIPNPVIATSITKPSDEINKRRLLVISRMVPQKGLLRLLDVMKSLPNNYTLNIAGDGPQRSQVAARIKELNLCSRVKLLGMIRNVQQLIVDHDLMVLASFTEGFPNVVLESLSVGVPVVSFKVSGISALITNDFNGYIVEQGNLKELRENIIKSCNRDWPILAIKEEVNIKFGVKKVVRMYQDLLLVESSADTKIPVLTEA